MSRDASGTYTAPSNSWNPAVEGSVIDETAWNTTLQDIEDALTDSLSVSGDGKITAYIDFDEIAAPSSPAANVGRLYVRDVGGLTVLRFKDSAGTDYNLLSSVIAYVTPPQGRLSLVTGTSVMTTTQSAKTTVYYTPYSGLFVPLYNGSTFDTTTIGAELSQDTTDTTKSPAACTTNSNYDMFVWSDGGTMRCTRGPAWSSDTSRGTGAGTSELTRVGGVYLNAVAITNGPAASRGTYVGTIRTNGSSQVDWIYGGSSGGGTAGFFGVWNAYNRVNVSSLTTNATDSWTLASTSTRSANGSATMRCSYVMGLAEDTVYAAYQCVCVSGAGGIASIGVGYDSTSAFSGIIGHNTSSSITICVRGEYSSTGIGFHYMQAVEASLSGGTATYVGDGGVSGSIQNGLHVLLRA